MGKVVLYSTVSVDGFIADDNDQPGPLFDWMSSGTIARLGGNEMDGLAEGAVLELAAQLGVAVAQCGCGSGIVRRSDGHVACERDGCNHFFAAHGHPPEIAEGSTSRLAGSISNPARAGLFVSA